MVGFYTIVTLCLFGETAASIIYCPEFPPWFTTAKCSDRGIKENRRFSVASVVEVYCAHGFWDDTRQVQIVTCQGNGKWNEEIKLKCTKRLCKPPKFPKNAFQSTPEAKVYDVGQKVEFACKAGTVNLQLHGEGLVCSLVGTPKQAIWAGNPPICNISCPIIKENSFPGSKLRYSDRAKVTTLTSGTVIKPKSKASIRCKDGFQLRNGRANVLFCDESGKWNGSLENACVNMRQCDPPKLRGKNSESPFANSKKFFNINDTVRYFCVGSNVPSVANKDMTAKCIRKGKPDSKPVWNKIPHCRPARL